MTNNAIPHKRQVFWTALLVGAVAVLPFLQTFTFSHLRLDDWGYTLGCAFVRGGFSLENVGKAFCDLGNGAIWMPLTYITYMLDVGGGWGVQHLVNAALHAVNAMLVLLLLWRLAERFGFARDRVFLVSAALAALLWALHPLRVEPVAWVAARKELLWTLFGLLSLVAWADRGFSFLAFGFFVAACLCKPTALCLPFVMFALAFFTREKGAEGENVRRWRGRIVGVLCLLVSAGVGALTVFSQSHPTGFAAIDIYDTTIGWRALNAAVSTGLYLWETICPIGIHFDYRAVFEGWPLRGTLGLVVLAVSLVGIAVLWRLPKGSRMRKACLFAVVGGFLSVLPTLGLFGIVGDHALADRYVYFPSALATLPLAGAIAWGMRQKRKVILSIAALVLAGETAMTIPLVGTFRDDVAVFTRVLKLDRDHWRALEYLGSEYCARLGRLEEGVAMLKRSLSLSPRPSSAATLAYVLAVRGKGDDFAEVWRLGREIALHPKLDAGGMMLDALGIVAMREGKDKDAINFFSKSLVAPKRAHPNVHSMLNLGLCLANVGRDREALEVLAKLKGSRDKAIRARAEEARAKVASNEPYARFEWSGE